MTPDTPIDIAALRRDYATRGLRRADLPADPIEQFLRWFKEAVATEPIDPNAMTLSTVTREGGPASRVVLLKGVDARGFIFFTNYGSEKGRQLAANPRAALTFFWRQLERQVCVTGRVSKTSREESEAYFLTRPHGSKLGAWASEQSEVIENRAALEKRLKQVSERFSDGEVPIPPAWGGFRVEPETVEFWQGRTNRLHDRLRYARTDAGWRIERLSP